MSIETYIKQRVKDQVDWYRERTGEQGKIVEQGKRFSIAFAVAGVILSGLSGMSSQWEWLGLMPGWIPVVGAFSAAFAAHYYAERHEYLQLSYRATGRRLTRLLERWQSPHTDRENPTEQRTFIKYCEDTISVENQAWMAELLKEDETPSVNTGL